MAPHAYGVRHTKLPHDVALVAGDELISIASSFSLFLGKYGHDLLSLG